MLVHRVLHPTDFSPASQVAFAHALAVALARRATLTVLNASPDFDASDWTRFPRVRETLVRWGLLGPGSDRSAVLRELHVRVMKVGVDASHPVDAVLDYLADNPSDLLVLATEGREGLPRFLRGSVAQKVARVSGVRALFVPAHERGFVQPDDGSLSLRHILVPVADSPDPRAAAQAAAGVAETLGTASLEIHPLHVGTRMPALEAPPGPWTWRESLREGEPVPEILAAARELPADLIVMATDGRDGFIDVFRGSHAERVVRGAPCPVLTIPLPRAD